MKTEQMGEIEPRKPPKTIEKSKWARESRENLPKPFKTENSVERSGFAAQFAPQVRITGFMFVSFSKNVLFNVCPRLVQRYFCRRNNRQ